MLRIPRLMLLTLIVSMCSLVAPWPLSAQEHCGVVHTQRREPLNSQRFWALAEYGGKAFLDLQTCLIVRLEVFDEPVTLSDAMQRCATLGQGGPTGDMGWQLPSMSELTSLDSDLWEGQRGEFERYKIPPLSRSERDFWTTTKWPGKEGSWAAVMFSARTTIVHPLAETEKAGAWCVQGYRASGLDKR
jgi:hypothetical protein